MPRQYYEIPEEAYLFGKQLTERSKEEKIRQWALFELLSFYQINIRDLKIEVPIKIGTRIHFADIVVYKEHVPFAVIECKHQEEDKEQQSIEQAISYANSNTLKAKFAVYTNGSVWIVRRKIEENWISFPDLPKYPKPLEFIKFSDLTDALQRLEPLLYWTHETVPSQNAKKYFSFLEIFFAPSNPLLKEINEELIETIHHTLIILHHLKFVIDTEENEIHFGEYCEIKIAIAYKHLVNYLESYSPIKINEKFMDVDYVQHFKWGKLLPREMQNLLREIIHEKDINNHEINLIKLLWILVEYLQDIVLEKQHTHIEHILYKPIKETVTGSFLKFISPLLEEHYGITFPDAIHDSDLLHNLKYRWEELWNKNK